MYPPYHSGPQENSAAEAASATRKHAGKLTAEASACLLVEKRKKIF